MRRRVDLFTRQVVVRELRKVGDGRADANVVAWLSTVDATACYISAITLMEIELGILRIERRDAVQGAKLRGWMDARIRPEFSERTRSTRRSRSVALRLTRQTCAPKETHSSPQRRSCTA
jgi:hypothetical protein